MGISPSTGNYIHIKGVPGGSDGARPERGGRDLATGYSRKDHVQVGKIKVSDFASIVHGHLSTDEIYLDVVLVDTHLDIIL